MIKESDLIINRLIWVDGEDAYFFFGWRQVCEGCGFKGDLTDVKGHFFCSHCKTSRHTWSNPSFYKRKIWRLSYETEEA